MRNSLLESFKHANLFVLTFLQFTFFMSFLQGEQYPNWIVVTTIQYPTEALKKLASIPGWHLVVVGDKKTPKDWHLQNCDYLDVEKQIKLGYKIAELLPERIDAPIRKNNEINQ